MQQATEMVLKGCADLFMSFHVYFDKQVHKKLEKKLNKQKKKKN